MPPTDGSSSKPLPLRAAFATCFCPDNTALVSLSRDVVLWDVAARAKRYRVHPLAHPCHCDIDPRGNSVAIKSTSGLILTLRIDDGVVVGFVSDGSEGEGANLIYSPCSQFIVDGSWKGCLIVRSAETGAIDFLRQVEGEMVSSVQSDRTRRIWAIHHKRKFPSELPDVLSLWRWPFRKPTLFEFPQDNILAFALSPDGRLIATSHSTGRKRLRLVIRSLRNFDVVSEMLHANNVRSICWSPDGNELAIVADDEIAFYRYPELTLAANFSLSGLTDLSYSPSGEWIAVSGLQGVLLRRNTITPISSAISSAR